MINGRFLVAAIILVAGVPAFAEQVASANATSSSTSSTPYEREFRERLRDLERQLELLRQQLSGVGSTNGDAPTQRTTEAPSPTPPAVHEQIEALDQRLRVIAREDESRREAVAEQSRTAPGPEAGRDGFQLRSADGSFLLRLRGLAQSDGRFFVSDTGETGTDTFLMRRVRPILEATMFKNFDLRLMPDFGNGVTVVQDAYLDLRFTPAFRVRAGKMKQPFGLERLVSASELLFGERALPTTVAGNRDIGVMAYGDLLAGRVWYSGGLFNGVVDGGSADADDRDGKDVVVRFFAHPFRTSKNERLQGLGLGVAASHGSQRGTAAAPALAAYRSSGQQIYFRYASDGTVNGTAVADGTRQRISAQGYYYAGRFGLLAEQVLSAQRVRRGDVTIDAEVSSWQFAPSWVLTGERATYRGVEPRTPFDPANRTWGAFEIAARYNQVSVDSDLFPLFATKSASAKQARATAAGLNWYMNRNVKVACNYEETHFTGGAAAGSRRPERQILSRLQFSF